MADYTLSVFFLFYDSFLCTEFVKLRLLNEYWVTPRVNLVLLIYRSLVWSLFICKEITALFWCERRELSQEKGFKRNQQLLLFKEKIYTNKWVYFTLKGIWQVFAIIIYSCCNNCPSTVDFWWTINQNSQSEPRASLPSTLSLSFGSG